MPRSRIVIQESQAEIKRMILVEVSRQLNKGFIASSFNIESEIRKVVRLQITNHPTWRSLLGDGSGYSLKAEFGLNNASGRTDAILQQWLSGISVIVKPLKPSSGGIKGGISLKVVDRSWSDVISLPEASVITKDGKILPWLEWLLKFGNKIIIRGYDVRAVPGAGRSGLALMVEGKGKRWRVPPEHSGTTQNNFVTQSLENIQDDIIRIISKHIKI